jgi:hypothetical protein
MDMPFMKKEINETIEDTIKDNKKNGKDQKKDTGTYYTGNKSKNLLIHIMQDGIEVDKPIKSKIYEQSVSWRMRKYPIVPERFTYDYNGVAHQYVDVNDVAVLTWKKDHEDNCIKCGGKMTVDARESRALGRRGIFSAIWALDSTHMILILVFAIGAMAMAGAFFWAYSNDVKHATQLENANKEIVRLNNIINPPPPPTPDSNGNIGGGSSIQQGR